MIKKSVDRNERKSGLEAIQLNTKYKLQKRCHCKQRLLNRSARDIPNLAFSAKVKQLLTEVFYIVSVYL